MSATPEPVGPRPRPAARRHTLRTASAALLLAFAAAPAAAQTVSAGYRTGCGPGTGCAIARFTIAAGSDALLLRTLTLAAAPSTHTFVPPSGLGTYGARDDAGAFGGAFLADMGGRRILLDFLGTGVPFTLAPGSSGFVDLELASAAAVPFDLTFSTVLATGATVTGSVVATAVVPEPSTVVLLATGLAALGVATRRRRRPG